jgi:hypothetical protein
MENSAQNKRRSIDSFGTQPESKREKSLMGRIKKMRGWDAFLVLMLAGTGLLSSPAVILAIINPDTLPNLKLGLTPDEQFVLLSSSYQAVRWSLWLSCTWGTFVILSYIIDSLPLIIETAVIIFMGICTENVKQALHVIPVVKFWLRNCLTSVCAAVFYRFLFFQLYESRLKTWQDVYKFLWAATVFLTYVLIQRIIVQMIAFDFHKVAYQDRILQCQNHLEILDDLQKSIVGFGYRRVLELGTKQKHPSEPDIQKSAVLDGCDDLNQSRAKKSIFKLFERPKASHDTSKKKDSKSELSSPAGSTEKVQGATLQLQIDDPTLKVDPTFEKQGADDDNEKDFEANQILTGAIPIGEEDKKKKKVTLELYSDENARSIAGELFFRLSKKGMVTVDDFIQWLPEKDAHRAFSVFNPNQTGTLGLKDFQSVCKRIYRDKRSLTIALSDISQALGNLNKILYAITVVATILSSLSIFSIDFNALLPFTSIFLALSFVFGGAARKTFESIIFIFVTHPYDAGDRIFLEGTQSFIVEELNILTTTLRSEGKVIYVNNGTANINGRGNGTKANIQLPTIR